MTDDDRDDPEVARDAAIRAAGVRIREREGEAGEQARLDRITAYRPDKIIGMWRCRRTGCTNLIGVTEAALERLATCNGILRQMGEPPLDHTAPVDARERAPGCCYCEVCRREYNAGAPARRRQMVDRLADGIRQLKDCGDPTRERALIAQLEQWGHPDVKGLVAKLSEQRGTKSRGRV